MLTLTFTGMAGDGRLYKLADDHGYEDAFLVSSCEMKVDPQNAVSDAIRKAMHRYESKTKAVTNDC